jgi:hypothetical protein
VRGSSRKLLRKIMDVHSISFVVRRSIVNHQGEGMGGNVDSPCHELSV